MENTSPLTGTCGTISWQLPEIKTRLIIMWSVPFNFNLRDSYFAIGLTHNKVKALIMHMLNMINGIFVRVSLRTLTTGSTRCTMGATRGQPSPGAELGDQAYSHPASSKSEDLWRLTLTTQFSIFQSFLEGNFFFLHI